MRKRIGILALAAALIVVGCGGNGTDTTSGITAGGSGSSGGGTGGGAGLSSVSLFATDSLVEGYDHVYVTIRKVVLKGSAGTATVFDEAEGRVVDLRALRDKDGRRFRLLGNAAVRSGRFDSLEVMLADKTTIFPTGSGEGTEATFEGTTEGVKVMSLTLPGRSDLPRQSQMIVDFDLASWNLEGTTVSATGGQYLKLVEDRTIGDKGRHERDEYAGTVGNLQGNVPEQTFNLTRGVMTVTVKTNAATAIYNGDGSVSPVLVNGAKVHVFGAYSTSDNSVLAERIKVAGEEDSDVHVFGRTNSFTADSNTVEMEVARINRGLPRRRAITVTYADDAKFFGARGATLSVADFEARLKVGGILLAEGTLADGNLKATKLKLEAEGNEPGGHETEVRGSVANVNATAGTFTLALAAWQGMLGRPDLSIAVVTRESTVYRLGEDVVQREAFFAALAAGATVSVEGRPDPGKRQFVASEVRLPR